MDIERLSALVQSWREIAEKHDARAERLNESGDASDAAWCEAAAEHRSYCADELATLIAELGQEVGAVPSFRGYANLGVGAYLLEHSAEGEDAELCIVPATEAEKAGRTVGDLRHFEGERDPIPAERMAVRIRFDNVAGLDALEQQLRLLREVHFPASPAHTSEARDALMAWAVKNDVAAGECDPNRRVIPLAALNQYAAMRQEAGDGND